ncbi:unnamed protein product [Agarophyton chilense]|eukprot:gb/GEZJ01001362.1/.p1 GENE.gb/GEZJ01001362.1/~~gb/GEZJ01001362.1/.p1  ORF type:complete len:402 (-),score=57.33 gb/GEZJ01001362.1/:403-1608(-)
MLQSQSVELRFAARALANKDLLSLSDPFLVCHTLRDGRPVHRIGRTETVKDDLNPVWYTTICFSFHPVENASSALLVDVFDRDSSDTDTLVKHDFLGRAVVRIARLLDAPHARLDIPLAPAAHILYPATTTTSLVTETTSEDDRVATVAIDRADVEDVADVADAAHHRRAKDLRRATQSARASKKVSGTLCVFAEPLHARVGHTFVFRISSAMLRDTGVLGRRVTQFYEIQRRREEGDQCSWSVVYRSKDGVNVDANNYIVFDEIAISERQLHNMQPNRALRIAFFKRHTRKPHQLISYINTTMRTLMDATLSLSDVTIPLEGQFGDDDALGTVLLQRIDKWQDYTSRTRPPAPDSAPECCTFHIHLRADHFLHKRFVSSLNHSPRSSRTLWQKPAFMTMH